VVTASSVSRDFDISYHTARKDLEKLVEVGIIEPMENARQRTYIATELVRIAYHPLPPRPVVQQPELVER
jgi:predicted transcriptional regulator